MSHSKILFILHLPPPVHGASMMGQYIHDSHLINEKFDCRYINLSASENVDEVGKLNLRKIGFLFTNMCDVIRTVVKERPQLSYLTPTSGGWGFLRDFVMVKVLRMLRVNVILHFHNKASKEWVEKKRHFPFVKSFFKGLNIILLSEELYAERAPFIDKKCVFLCPNGIPSVAPLGNSLRLEHDKVHFLFLSNMMKEKGVYILLEACAILRQKGFDFQCDFVGGWKDVSETDFNSKIAESGLQDSVNVHGAKFGQDKARFWTEADVFVFPTYYQGECFPLVLLEAMDYSIPCISTNNGAIENIIKDGETGFCIEQGDVSSLVERMIWMIDNTDERLEMGRNGKKRYNENFTLGHFEKTMVSILGNSCN